MENYKFQITIILKKKTSIMDLRLNHKQHHPM